MSEIIPKKLQKLITYFELLPGIGPKSARKLAMFILQSEENIVKEFAQTLIETKTKIVKCKICGNYTDLDEGEICNICKSHSRDKSSICVVETPKELWVIEATGEYNGLYHVLGGLISPIDNIGPEDLNIEKLIQRIRESKNTDTPVNEIIIALSPTPNGDFTTEYLVRLLKREFPELKISRLARGIPTGGELEFADTFSLSMAIKHREVII